MVWTSRCCLTLHGRMAFNHIHVAVGVLFLMFFSGYPCDLHAGEVTSQVKLLGNPFRARYPAGDAIYARNIWDMKEFQGHIYLGNGNSSNYAPAANAGPADIWYYDPGSDQFTKDGSLAQEQIEKFKLIDNLLCIPDHDPVGSALHGYSTRENGIWNTHQIPYFVHCYDMLQTTDTLFLALGVDDTLNPLRSSNDGGKTWTVLSIVSGEPGYPYYYCNRLFTLFNLNGVTYASGVMTVWNNSSRSSGLYYGAPLVRIDNAGKATILNHDTILAMFPGLDLSGAVEKYMLVVRPVNYKNQLIYIAGVNVNDHQWQPRGLFRAANIGQAQPIILTDNAMPRDILIGADGRCYVLGSITIGTNQVAVTVSSSSDLVNWREDFRFMTDTFARSFEQLGGKFYFGMGCETSPLVDSCGNIMVLDTVPSTPVNHPPTSLSLNGTSVAEASAAGTVVGTLMASDPDVGDTLSYQLVDPAGDAGGCFKLVDNQLCVANPALLDYEAATSHQVSVRVSDDAGLGLERTFTIDVTNINEPPIITFDEAAQHGAIVNFNSNGNSLSIVPGSTTITDPDGDLLTSLSLTLTNRPDGSQEGLTAMPLGAIKVLPYDPNTGQLKLIGRDTAANYQQILRSVNYFNCRRNPDTTDRMIGIIAGENALVSDLSTSTVRIIPQPFMVIMDGLTTITSPNGVVDLGNVVKGAPSLRRLCKIMNLGNATLDISNMDIPNGFTSNQSISSSVAPNGGGMMFTIELPTQETGSFSGIVSVDTNQVPQESFSFTVKGSVDPPQVKSAAREWASYH